ncbi:hypothetical protein [Blastococcus brunescens]|uniref:FtsX-like permease family protein n=1 Tax=Blastococcus brunescens TaxID=1564165 RepID=A0ABZ1B442_9ACTN|nr:hypothetical protein [Blastococcus sp. BMG 8361]WRL65565.1 hypothetical protein U6N30_08235 [Blastococcus sp. BMG 8361]
MMVSMMAYGALGAALGATIRISFDRASGWLRQLRVTPVPQTQVFAVDVAVGAILALPSLVVVALVGRFINGVELAPSTWVALVGVLWAGSIAFVALGLLIGLSLEEKAAGERSGSSGSSWPRSVACGGRWRCSRSPCRSSPGSCPPTGTPRWAATWPRAARRPAFPCWRWPRSRPSSPSSR